MLVSIAAEREAQRCAQDSLCLACRDYSFLCVLSCDLSVGLLLQCSGKAGTALLVKAIAVLVVTSGSFRSLERLCPNRAPFWVLFVPDDGTHRIPWGHV